MYLIKQIIENSYVHRKYSFDHNKMVYSNIFYSLQVFAHVHTSNPNLNMLVASCIWGP